MSTLLFVDHVIPGVERCCIVIRNSDHLANLWQRYLKRQELSRVMMGPEWEGVGL